MLEVANKTARKFDQAPRGSATPYLEELGRLVGEPGIPRAVLDGIPRLYDVGYERFFIKMPITPTALANDPRSLLQVTDRFLRYMAAFRARDWKQVLIIQQENIS